MLGVMALCQLLETVVDVDAIKSQKRTQCIVCPDADVCRQQRAIIVNAMLKAFV
jgi:alpha-D-ribose 1-methylphosphonate 5-phosphate C-P lyase